MGRLPAGRRLRGEAGHRHRRRDVEGDPRRPLRGRGADRDPATPPRPLARRRPPGSSAQGSRSPRPSAIRPPPAPATRRAQRAFLEHRKAKQTGLILTARPSTPNPTRAKNTNEFSASRRPAVADTAKNARTNSPDYRPACPGRGPVTRPTVRRRPPVHRRAQPEQRPAVEQEVDADHQPQDPGAVPGQPENTISPRTTEPRRWPAPSPSPDRAELEGGDRLHHAGGDEVGGEQEGQRPTPTSGQEQPDASESETKPVSTARRRASRRGPGRRGRTRRRLTISSQPMKFATTKVARPGR